MNICSVVVCQSRSKTWTLSIHNSGSYAHKHMLCSSVLRDVSYMNTTVTNLLYSTVHCGSQNGMLVCHSLSKPMVHCIKRIRMYKCAPLKSLRSCEKHPMCLGLDFALFSSLGRVLAKCFLCFFPILWSSHCVGPFSHISQ